jgi:hypothetical protein
MEQLQTRRKVTYRSLKYIFGLDESLLEEIREELLLTGVARDEGGKILVWTGEAESTSYSAALVPSPSTTAGTTTVASSRIRNPKGILAPAPQAHNPTTKSIFSVVREDDSVFAHKTPSYADYVLQDIVGTIYPS